MGFLSTDDERLRELERKIVRLERDVNRKFLMMEESFSVLRNVLAKMQRENIELKNDRDFLLERYKDLLKKIPVDTSRLVAEVKEKLVKPAKKSFDDNVILLEKIATEGIITDEERIENLSNRYSAPLDELFHLVMEKKRIKIRDAAKRFKVHEARIEQWGKLLQNYDILEVVYSEAGIELRKKGV